MGKREDDLAFAIVTDPELVLEAVKDCYSKAYTKFCTNMLKCLDRQNNLEMASVND